MPYYYESCIIKDSIISDLQKYQISIENLKNTKYVGGDKGRHARYWKMLFKDEPFPPKQEKCVCNHIIKENCYIMFEDKILVVGNQCIKKFTPNYNRTCEICGATHKSRKINRCKNCKRI